MASNDQLTKVSTEATTDFVTPYYGALNSNRDTIASFYTEPTTELLFNGNQVADGSAVQDIFQNQMPKSHYEVQSLDCQILNKAYPTMTPAGTKPAAQMTIKDMSILVIVSGFVRYGDVQEARGFSETFVLIPNPSAAADRGKRRRDWLIQSQNFRLAV